MAPPIWTSEAQQADFAIYRYLCARHYLGPFMLGSPSAPTPVARMVILMDTSAFATALEYLQAFN